MTAPRITAVPPRARLTQAAVVLACCLAVYVIAVPLLVRGGTIGWRLALTVAVAEVASVGVLAALWRLRRTLAGARTELAQQAAQAAQLTQDAERQGERARQQADEITGLKKEITGLTDRVTGLTDELAACRKRERQLQAESGELRDDLATRLQAQAQTVTDAVRYTLRERIPPVLEGITPPPAATGIDDELAELLELATTTASDGADQRQSMRSAVAAMSRRVQASAHRIQEEATLMAERHPGDADVLEVSMRVDHAAAQQARTAQSMAVLLGEWPGQQWPDPLPLVDVVRAAAGRIIAYRRVEVVGDPDIAASAPAVEPLIHLIAELLANATQSSPPSTQVPVTVRSVQRGAVIEVHDCGIGLDDYRLAQARAVATGEQLIGLEDLGEFPRTGLAVVGQYVRRHGFRLDISESVYGGVRAIVGIPAELAETAEPADSIPVQAAPVPAEATAATGTATMTATAAEMPAVTREHGLPRRVSPRRGGSAGGAAPDSAADGLARTTPEEAGAWMNAFLATPKPDGNSVAPEDN